jgi:hypothetical protein
MTSTDPVTQLDAIFKDNLGEDWDLLDDPEAVVLGVPRGTVAALLRQIDDKLLWPDLMMVARRHSDQWMLDLSSFLPHEEKFVKVMVDFLLMAKTEHAKVGLAQDADEWFWEEATFHLLPQVIARIEEIRRDLDGSDYSPVAATLDGVISTLKTKMGDPRM